MRAPQARSSHCGFHLLAFRSSKTMGKRAQGVVKAVDGKDNKRIRQTTDERYSHLISLGKVSYVSKSGIENLLKAVRDPKNFPESSSRRTQYRARKATCNFQTEYGPLIKSADAIRASGEVEPLSFQYPLAWFAYHASSPEAMLGLCDMPCRKNHAPPPINGNLFCTRTESTRVMAFRTTIPVRRVSFTGRSLILARKLCAMRKGGAS